MARNRDIRNVVPAIQRRDSWILKAVRLPIMRWQQYRIIYTVDLAPVAASGNAQMRNERQPEQPTLQMPDHARIISFQFFAFNPIDGIAVLGGPIGLSRPACPLLSRPLRDTGENNRFVAMPNHARVEDTDHLPIRMAGRHVLRTKQ